jgi:hypothetical protein
MGFIYTFGRKILGERLAHCNAAVYIRRQYGDAKNLPTSLSYD